MLGQAVSAVTDATHGMTLAAVALPYYRYIMADGLPKFARFAQNVWGIDAAGKADEQLAAAGVTIFPKRVRQGQPRLRPLSHAGEACLVAA